MKRLVALVMATGVLSACPTGGGSAHHPRTTRRALVASPTTASTRGSSATTVPRPGDAVKPETLAAMSFVDASHGFGLTGQSVVAATVDGGASWFARGRVPGPADMGPKVVFFGASNGVVLAGGVFVTRDGGATWTNAPFAKASGLVAAGTNLWAFVGEPGHVEASTDEGRTWHPLPSQPAVTTFVAMVRPSASEAYVLSSAGGLGVPASYQISATTDGGRHWRSSDAPCDRSTEHAALAALSRGQVWIVCGSQPATIMQFKSLYRSSDGGMHWRVVASTGEVGSAGRVGDIPLSGSVDELFAGSDQRAWMLFGRTGLWATADGGQTWHQPFSFEADGQSGPATFIDDRDGWVVAKRVVWHTRDAVRWDPLGTPKT